MFFIRSNARALASIDKKIINYTTPNKVKRFQFQSSNWELGASCRTGPESAPPPQSRRALGSPGVGVAAPEVRMRHAHGPNGHQPENTAAHPAAFPFFGWRVTAFFFSPSEIRKFIYIQTPDMRPGALPSSPPASRPPPLHTDAATTARRHLPVGRLPRRVVPAPAPPPRRNRERDDDDRLLLPRRGARVPPRGGRGHGAAHLLPTFFPRRVHHEENRLRRSVASRERDAATAALVGTRHAAPCSAAAPARRQASKTRGESGPCAVSVPVVSSIS